jgi:SAM-dependent methyltransferase
MPIIPFYGVDRPDLFEIERAAMDRPGRVIDRLDRLLPSGTIADIGAGDGFTAQRLSRADRRIVCVEPARAMIKPQPRLTWVQADAAQLPFRDASLDGAYATWAYFFSRGPLDPTPGVRELHRTVQPGGPLVIADNAGNDEFTALANRDLSADPSFWRRQGFGVEIVESTFAFDSPTDAWRLLDFYFDGIESAPPTEFTYRVALFIGVSQGPPS